MSPTVPSKCHKRFHRSRYLISDDVMRNNTHTVRYVLFDLIGHSVAKKKKIIKNEYLPSTCIVSVLSERARIQYEFAGNGFVRIRFRGVSQCILCLRCTDIDFFQFSTRPSRLRHRRNGYCEQIKRYEQSERRRKTSQRFDSTCAGFYD